MPKNNFNKYKNNIYIQKISLSAMFIALAAVTKLFSITIPMFGTSGMKVGFGGVFTTFPALLFGPLYGGVASACSDIIGHLMNPLGAYNPLYTATAFLGGALKGIIWYLIKNRKTINIRAAVTSFLLIIGVIAVSFHISLSADGIIKNFIAVKEDIPSKIFLEQNENNFFSKAVISLARYNKDIYTISKAANSQEIIIPSTVTADGSDFILRIGERAFNNCLSLKTITIPSAITIINNTAFEGIDGFTIICEADSKAEDFAKTKGYTYEIVEEIVYKTITVQYNSLSTNEFTLTNSFTKTLAGYINFVTIGLEAVTFFGLIFVLIEYIYSKKKNFQKNSYGLRIFTSIFIPGLIVTTLNTVILKYVTFKDAWSNRLFMIVWVPRAAEELIILIIQAFFITMLYQLYVSNVKNDKLK